VQAAHSQGTVREPPPSSELLQNATGANDAFAAVGRYQGASTCTGSLIDPSGSGASEAKAWLLTAGHCISLEPYGVIRNQPSTAEVQFHYFIDTPDRRVTGRSRAIGWSTMKSTDLALVELDATLGDLLAHGIRPLRLAARTPEAGRSVFWTGISGSPIPAELQFLRRGRCTRGREVQLLEGPWIWNDVLSNDCPDLYRGASGSPLFDAESGEVIGVIGTSTLMNFAQGPDYDCQVNRPCVVRAGGTVMEKDTSYAAPVRDIVQCFDRVNNLEVERPGCPLDPGVQLTVRSVPIEVRPEADGNPATWDAALSGSQRRYAYKHFPAGEGECGSAAGYSAPIPVAVAPMIRDPIGGNNGYYMLCVVAGDSASMDSSWQQPVHASVRFKRLDSQPPAVGVDYQLEEIVNGYRLLLSSTAGDGPSGLGVSTFKRGPPSATDCSDPRDYRVQTSIPHVIRTSDMPARICSKLSDKAGNTADPAVFDFGAPAMLPDAMRNGASLERGSVAAGGTFRVDTFNLTDRAEFSTTPVMTLAGVRMAVVDSAGRTLPVPMTTAGPLYLEAVMPDSAAPGRGTVVVQPPQGASVSQTVMIGRTAPGLYFDIRTATPSGYASDRDGNLFLLGGCSGRECYITHLPLSSTPGGLDFVLYGTGLRGSPRSVWLRIGTHTVGSMEVRPHADIVGVDELYFHLPRDFPLRLYQVISAETPDGASNHLWLYLE
jgi:uncharacterized protein (TIGR03437 family)